MEGKFPKGVENLCEDLALRFLASQGGSTLTDSVDKEIINEITQIPCGVFGRRVSQVSRVKKQYNSCNQLINKSQQTIDNRRQTEGNQVYLNCRGATCEA